MKPITSCSCGASYVPVGIRAAEAIAKSPEKSNRAIAAELGVDEWSVRKARKKSGAGHPAPEKRLGKDGLDWAREAFSIVPPDAPARGVYEPSGERSFAYIDSLDVAALRLLITAALRRLMTGRSRDQKVELTAWVATLCKSLAVEEFGYLTDVVHIPNFERTYANAYGDKRKARDDKAKVRRSPIGARAAAAIAECPEMSNRAIAAEIGVGVETVRRARNKSGAS